MESRTGPAVSIFTFILTERCGWNCAYCYQPRGRKTMSRRLLDSGCDAIFPRLSASPAVQFYGGEPLLAFDLIRRAVERLKSANRRGRKRLRFVLTTNGALLDPEILAFLDEHRFELMLSFDGLAQDRGREKGSFRTIAPLFDALPRYPRIRPATNSVFGPRTVGWLAKSVAWIAGRDIPNILLSFDYQVPWPKRSIDRLAREVGIVRKDMLGFARAGHPVPLVNFRALDDSAIFGCTAGRDRLALAPDGRLWGCYGYADFFRARPDASVSRRFGLGTIADFVRSGGARPAEVLAEYARGRMDAAFTGERFCRTCSSLNRCSFCPPVAALKNGIVGEVPTAACRINRLMIRQRELFWRQAGEGTA